MQSDQRIVLYNYYRSSCSFRVRIALNLKKLEFDYVPVHLVKGEQDSEFYCQKNPQKLVPSIEIDGITIYESLPIIEYLDETRPDICKLYPSDPAKKAYIRQFCEAINAGIQPICNFRVLQKISKDFNADKLEWIASWCHKGFEAIEKMLEKHAGKYCFGDDITAADCVLFPQVYLSKNRFKVSLENYPHIEKVLNNLSQLQEFERALPKNQPDYEE